MEDKPRYSRVSDILDLAIFMSSKIQGVTINEIAEELGINPIFVEDEVAVLEEYGYMDKLSGGKYRTNIYID